MIDANLNDKVLKLIIASSLCLWLCAGIITAQIKSVAAKIVAESDAKEPFRDSDLSVRISNKDLLTGVVLKSNLALQNGKTSDLTDGVGGQPQYKQRVFGLNDTTDWVVTFSKLKIKQLHEIRVFSWNRDSRAAQDYDVAFSHDGGKTFKALAKDAIVTKSNALNLTRITVRVGAVTDLRFTFRSAGERKRPTNEQHSAIVEIDAIGIGTIVSTRPPAAAEKPIRTATRPKAKPAPTAIPPKNKPIVLPKATRSMAEVRAAGRRKSSLLGETTQAPRASGQAPKPKLAAFKAHVAPAITKTCVQCHGPKKQKGKFRIDTLDPDLLKGADINKWLEVFDVLSNGEMPPEEDDVKLSDADRSQMIDWLSSEIQVASQVRQNEKGHSSFRRLTRYEYNYALQDLLGLPYVLADSLPPETASEDGFKNSSQMLQMSAMQFETYRALGLKALRHATVRGERPKMVVYRMAMKKAMNKAKGTLSAISNENIGKVHLLNPKGGTNVSLNKRNHSLKLNLNNHLPDEGIMRVSMRVGRTTSNANEYASLRLIFSAHTSNNANFSQVISDRDIPITATADKPQFIHFDIPLSEIQRNPFRKNKGKFPRRDEFLTIENITNANSKRDALSVHIDHIEISAPYYEQWPPSTHNAIFINSKNKSDEKKYGREVLTGFMARVWRRPVTSQELDQLMALFANYRREFTNFEDAMLEVLATALATPEFLYLTQKVPVSQSENSKTISDMELASRLSFFLWSSIPDDELLKLAGQGKLKEPRVLTAQVKRMLADTRSQRFSQNFVWQWLGMDGLNSVIHVNDSSLKQSMGEEPIAFFNKVLKYNRSVIDFIHSDYAVVNERLANHYRIPDVYGPHFRKVSITPQMNRGGILTGAGVLTMNSDGKDSHPLKRGIWLLEHVLHDPPPPPPPNVPEVDLTDPKILKMTLKERIADHRNQPACMSCHAKIDPWGIAFENFDAVGAYRTKIRNKPVDATSALFNKQQLAGMDGLKRFLLINRQDQFARAMVHKMTAYALGRPLSFSDRARIDSLAVQFRKRGDRLGDLVHLITRSDIFHAK
jgi:mono/diheme cytochrome c family protein